MLIQTAPDIKSSEITPKEIYLQRREFIKMTAAAIGAASLGAELTLPEPARAEGVKLANVQKSAYKVDEELTDYKSATQYNNFYEFGTDKESPAELAGTLKPRPWTVTVGGEAAKTGAFDLDVLLKGQTLEERVYRHRCVEAWSMVIPWVGFSLGAFLKQFEPNADAKYVEFKTLQDAKQMPGQKTGVLEWPYREGLRLDEAMHPLAILAVGLYGEVLPNQNGAPLRLIVPWKYGFKGIKSIVTINFTREMPKTSWNMQAANEYGFYANVNPEVDHPRWSQAKERKIGDFFKRKTLMFNGYADQVASLYSGLDLKKWF